MKRYNIAAVALLAGAMAAHAQINKGPGVSQEVIDAFSTGVFEGMPYRYLLPANYDPDTSYPLILNLHGRAGTGDDNISSLRKWTAVFVEDTWREQYPCIVVAPQSMDSWFVDDEPDPDLSEEAVAKYSEAWREYLERKGPFPQPNKDPSLSRAFRLVEDMAKRYSVDADRIYVIGHSMGGYGSWNAIWARPEYFAAAIPSAGGLAPWKDWDRIRNVPVWAFHGSADATVPAAYSREVFDRMKAIGGTMKYTEFGGRGHGTSMDAFTFDGDDAAQHVVTHYSSAACDRTDNVWAWLFKQRRTDR